MNDRSDQPPGGPSHASPGVASADCQPFSVWLNVCAGTLPNDVSLSHLEHAAECRSCSRLLSHSLASLAPEPTAEEQLLLDDLPSSSPAAQQILAKRLHAESARSRSASRDALAARRVRNPFSMFFAWSAVAVCALVLGAFLLLRPPSDATLLAQAYDQQRPSQLRLPGTEPGPLVSPTRGSATTAESTGLLRLKLRANDSLLRTPNDPRTRQMLGRIALVEHNGDSARSNFEVAAALDPNLPGITADLASAYFELAESSGQSLEYARAIDLFSQHLQKVPNDSVALYNRALCWERQAVPQQAIAGFQAALALEKDPQWRREIESHIARLKREAARQTTVTQQPPPAAVFLGSQDDPPGAYEMLLSLAARQWLPLRASDTAKANQESANQTEAALHKLAALGRQHNDLWLADMLDEPATPARRSADQALAAALSASSAGNADQALAASAAAMRLYRRLGRDPTRDPGYLRAAVEHIYTLQRMGLNQDCLREAAALAPNPRLARYAWLRTYLQLETAAAYGMLGDPGRDRPLSAAAAVQAALDGLPLSSLRATSFVLDDDIRLRHYESAWQQATTALRLSQTVRGAGTARFQIFSALELISKQLNLSWTAAGLASAAADAASTTRNQKITAYAMEELGLDELQVGDLDAANRSFLAADAHLARLGNGAAARRYAADWTSDRALLAARTLGPAAGIRMLSRQESDFQHFDAMLPRLHFYTGYADLLRQAHDTRASLQLILRAVAMAPPVSHAQPELVPPDIHKAYEVLIADLTEDNAHPELALRAWEMLQTGVAGRWASVTGEITPARLDSVLPPLPRTSELTLIVGRVLDRYILWSIGPGQSVRQHILAVQPAALSRRADTFLRLCADPRSSVSDLAILGAGLYNDLLAPADAQIDHATRIDLELDPSLAPVPFAALQAHGRYLGLDHPLVFLPAAWTLDRNRVGDSAGNDSDRLPSHPTLAVLEQDQTTRTPIPADYDESTDIVRLFPSTHLERASLWRSGSGLALSGSPSLKPLLARADVIHYVGHGLDDGTPGSASSAPSLTLSAGALPHCRLAVLAACRTLREREESREDVPSFARIVLAAGATHVLATQWDVDSRQTSRLMQHFYTALAARNSFPDALRLAQQTLQSDPASAHPYFWSGFQLVSNP